MTRATPYRVHTSSAPMAGKQAIEPMATVSHRGTIRFAALIGALGVAVTLALIAIGGGA